MDFKIITAYPWWFILLCIAFGLALTLVLYSRQRNNEYTLTTRWVLGTLRFLSATILAFLLISPMVQTIKRTTLKPSVVIGLDNSASILMSKDSVYYKNEFQQQLAKLKEQLEDSYEVNTYNFGEKVTAGEVPNYKDEISDLSAFFEDINSRYFNRNIGAVIMASDGIFNAGSDPLYQVRNATYPVYSINMGDTTSRKDIFIQRVNHNKIAFKGNKFPVEIIVQAVELSGETATLSVLDNNAVIFTQDINISSQNQVLTIPVLVNAEEAGLKRLRIQIDEIEGEVNTGNNSRDIFIEIRESRQKIAIVALAPHPDVAALQRVIENSNNFEVSIFTPSNFNEKPETFSLIILHQLPSLKQQFTAQLNDIIRAKIPVLYILGNQSNIQQFNSLNMGLAMVNFKGSYNEVLPSLNNSFSAFLYTDIQKKLIETVPPLVAPFAVYNVSNSVQIFAHQVIGSSMTDMPLIMFNQLADHRTGVITGEGIWRWRMYDYIVNSTHQNFDDLFGKMLQYMTIQSDRSKFRVTWNNFYAENENIEFNAVLLNDSYEPITDPEISLIITDEVNKKFEYTFSAGNQAYNLKIGNFPSGVYRFEATALVSGEEMKRTGSFVVTAINLEDIDLVANHKMLNTISSESGGVSVYPAQIDQLADLINKRDDMQSITYARKNFIDLIDYYPLMILLILLLGIEWFLRKFNGSY